MLTKIKKLARKNASEIIMAIGMIVFVIGVWGGVNAIGKTLEPKIREHETAQAYCYTASKMFFVSIACVPKEK